MWGSTGHVDGGVERERETLGRAKFAVRLLRNQPRLVEVDYITVHRRPQS